jgi:hypothetical protein
MNTQLELSWRGYATHEGAESYTLEKKIKFWTLHEVSKENCYGTVSDLQSKQEI